MKIGYKSVLSILLVLFLVISFAACGNSTTAGNGDSGSTAVVTETSANATVESAEKPKEVNTLKLTMYVDWYQQGWQAIEKDVNDNADKLGFKLDIDKIAGGDQGVQILSTRAATGDFPDLIALPAIYNIEEGMHAVDKLVDFTGSDWTNNYEQAFLSGNQYSKDGKLLGAPYGGISLPGVFYNKKVFSALGLSVPNTWDEFLAVCDKVKAAGKTPLFMSGKDTWTVQMLAIMGFQREFKSKDPLQVARDLNANTVNITSFTFFKDSFAKLKELKDKGYFQKNWLSDTYDAAQKAITDESSAMVMNGTWIMDDIAKKYTDKVNDVGAFTVPFEGDDPIGAGPPNSIFAFTTSRYVESTMAFISYFESVDTQNKYFAAQPGIPVMKGLTVAGVAPSCTDLYNQFTMPGRGQIGWQSAGIVPDIGSLPDYTMYVLVNGKTPDEVLQEMRKSMEKSAKAKGLEGW